MCHCTWCRLFWRKDGNHREVESTRWEDDGSCDCTRSAVMASTRNHLLWRHEEMYQELPDSSRKGGLSQTGQKYHFRFPPFQQSWSGIVQAEDEPCRCCNIFPEIILTHFYMHFPRDEDSTPDSSAASTAPLVRHCVDPGAKTLQGTTSQELFQRVMKVQMVLTADWVLDFTPNRQQMDFMPCLH